MRVEGGEGGEGEERSGGSAVEWSGKGEERRYIRWVIPK